MPQLGKIIGGEMRKWKRNQWQRKQKRKWKQERNQWQRKRKRKRKQKMNQWQQNAEEEAEVFKTASVALFGEKLSISSGGRKT